MWLNDIELLRVFEVSITGHKEWLDGVSWSKYITCFSVLDSCDNNFVLFASQRKSHARLLLFLLECIVEQLLHKFLWNDVSPILLFFFFSRGGSVCLSWLLEPSLSIKRKKILILLFVLTLSGEYHESVKWFIGTATPKKMSAVVYIIRPFVFISFYFFLPFGRFVLLYLTGLFYFSLTAFWK